MSAYSQEREEAHRARSLLKDWAGEGYLTEAQYRLMEAETPCDLSTTNIFLRAVLFLFGVIVACAAVGLFFAVFSGLARTTEGAILGVFGAIAYTAAEFAVAQKRFYRHGIEEALAVCAVGFLCVGTASTFPAIAGLLVPLTGAAASLWIWRRFRLHYAFLAAMIFVIWLPGYWTQSLTAEHLIVACSYTAALAIVAAAQNHRLAEASLWLGAYLALNLQLTPWLPQAKLAYPAAFYWFTWVAIWCLPAAILLRGIRMKDRFIIATGAIAAVLTLVTNKPYLGWPRHTWDPMLLGALLIAVALCLRRRLATNAGPGFTAERLSGKDKAWLHAGATVSGFATPQAPVPAHSAEVHFGGGDSAGGGATSDF
jgi:hypothetical protein